MHSFKKFIIIIFFNDVSVNAGPEHLNDDIGCIGEGVTQDFFEEGILNFNSRTRSSPEVSGKA